MFVSLESVISTSFWVEQNFGLLFGSRLYMAALLDLSL